MALENKHILEKFDPEVLREYDIRGVVGKNITSNTAYTIGRTFGHYVFINSSNKSIVVGYDGRLTSPKLHGSLCKGLIEAGLKVISIGIGPTPMTYFGHYLLKTDAAIIVKGKAFLKNKNKPFLIFLFNLNINDKECLIECKKQKYTVNAKIGFKK